MDFSSSITAYNSDVSMDTLRPYMMKDRSPNILSFFILTYQSLKYDFICLLYIHLLITAYHPLRMPVSFCMGSWRCLHLLMIRFQIWFLKSIVHEIWARVKIWMSSYVKSQNIYHVAGSLQSKDSIGITSLMPTFSMSIFVANRFGDEDASTIK